MQEDDQRHLFVHFLNSHFNLKVYVIEFDPEVQVIMEAWFADKFRILREHRTKLIAKSRESVPYLFLESTVFFHAFLIFTLLLILTAVYSQIHALDLFSFHPVLMSMGTIIFIAEGIIAYKNSTLVDIFGTLMQGSRKQKVRAIHQTLQILGSLCLGLGLLLMFINKFIHGRSLIPTTIHAMFGWMTLTLVVAQAWTGSQKMQTVDVKSAPKTYKWHGDAGLLVWDGLCLSIVLGMLEFFTISFFHIFVMMSVFSVWWMVHLQLKIKGTDSEVTPEDAQESEPMLTGLSATV